VCFRVVSLSGAGTSRIDVLAKMKAAASGSAGKDMVKNNFPDCLSRSILTTE